MRSIQLAASTTKRSSLQFSNTARQQLRLPTFYTALHFQGNVVEFLFILSFHILVREQI